MTDNSRRPNTPNDASEDTLWDADQREDSPLLSSDTPPTSGDTEDDVDAPTIYAQILKDNLPWHKRPSAYWLFPLYGIASITAGMLSSSLGLFETALLCREYMNRYPPSNSTMMTLTAAAAATATELTSGLLNTMADSPSTTLPPTMTGDKIPYRPGNECKAANIQAFIALALGVMQVLGAIFGMLSVGYWASLSDKHGRIKLMLLGALSSLIMLTCLVIMSKWWDEVGFPLLYIMAIIGGLLGGIGLNSAMSFAYAADCTASSERSLMFSRLFAGLFLGLAIGPFFGGWLTDATDSIMPLLVICYVGTLLSGAFLAFVVPESLPSKQSAYIQKLYEQAIGPKAMKAAESSKKSQENVPWYSHLFRSLLFFKPNGHNTNFIILSAISFLQTLALNGTFSVLVLYTFKVFDWRAYEVGVLSSLGSTVRLVSLLIFLPILVHSFHKWNSKKRQAQTSQPQAHEGPDKDLFRNSSSASTSHHPWADHLDRNDTDSNNNTYNNIRGPLIGEQPEQILAGLDDLNAASSIEHLGEAALNLSGDEASFHERRRRQSDIDPTSTLTAKQAKNNNNYSSTTSPTNTTSRKQSVGSTDSQTSQQGQRKKAEKARDDLKLDTWIIRLGFIINSTTYIGYGIATEGWMFTIWSSLHALSIIAAPSVKSLITSQVEPSQFGAVLGAVQVLDSMSGALSPLVISWVYAATVGTRPEFVWYTCAGLTGICVVLAFMIRQRQFGRRASNV
ncbi:MAG: major facilitator superfamily domain-containing protein [Linnemannia gamsii]|nr:MAG: major facilitator superfamily domain-containing protein [Linnemannia gamsii]